MAGKQRCYSLRHKNYADYGGRRMRILPLGEQFEAFAADKGPKPTPEYTLERDDNDGHSEPGKCRWAARAEQSRNKRNNRHLTSADSLTQLLAELGAGVGAGCIRGSETAHPGWEVSVAVTQPRTRACTVIPELDYPDVSAMRRVA